MTSRSIALLPLLERDGQQGSVSSHREAKRAVVRNSTDELLALLSLIWSPKG